MFKHLEEIRLSQFLEELRDACEHNRLDRYLFVLGSDFAGPHSLETPQDLVLNWLEEEWTSQNPTRKLPHQDKVEPLIGWAQKTFPTQLQKLNSRETAAFFKEVFEIHCRNKISIFRSKMREKLKKKEPGIGHVLLAAILHKINQKAVLVTGYDDLLEFALRHFFDVEPLILAHPDVSQRFSATHTPPVLVKVYGDLHFDTYDPGLDEKHLEALIKALGAVCPVFLGFGRKDQNFRRILTTFDELARAGVWLPSPPIFAMTFDDGEWFENKADISCDHEVRLVKGPAFDQLMVMVADSCSVKPLIDIDETSQARYQFAEKQLEDMASYLRNSSSQISPPEWLNSLKESLANIWHDDDKIKDWIDWVIEEEAWPVLEAAHSKIERAKIFCSLPGDEVHPCVKSASDVSKLWLRPKSDRGSCGSLKHDAVLESALAYSGESPLIEQELRFQEARRLWAEAKYGDSLVALNKMRSEQSDILHLRMLNLRLDIAMRIKCWEAADKILEEILSLENNTLTTQARKYADLMATRWLIHQLTLCLKLHRDQSANLQKRLEDQSEKPMNQIDRNDYHLALADYHESLGNTELKNKETRSAWEGSDSKHLGHPSTIRSRLPYYQKDLYLDKEARSLEMGQILVSRIIHLSELLSEALRFEGRTGRDLAKGNIWFHAEVYDLMASYLDAWVDLRSQPANEDQSGGIDADVKDGRRISPSDIVKCLSSVRRHNAFNLFGGSSSRLHDQISSLVNSYDHRRPNQRNKITSRNRKNDV